MELENVPKQLFKYKALNEYTYDLIKTDLIFLPTYDKLNDAFEGHITYDGNRFINKLINDVLQNPSFKNNISKEEYFEIINSNNPKEELGRWVYEESASSQINFEEFSLKLNESINETTNQYLPPLLDELKSKTLVLSFSGENDLNTMWVHYADSNKGICIEYDFYELNFIHIQNFCYKIKYLDSDDYRQHNEDLESLPETPYFNFVVEPFLRKTFDWKYENEWRIILPIFSFRINLSKKINEKQFLKLPKPKAIYLGVYIDNNDKETIMDICKKREIDLYQMKKSSHHPKLLTDTIFEFPRGMHGTEFLEEEIKTGNIESIIYNYFNSSHNDEDELRFLVAALEKLSKENQIDFLDIILFKKEIFPVLLDYYSNVLKFLNIMSKSGNFNELKTSDGLTIKENINQWINLCFTRWDNKKIVRYLIIFENLLKQYYSRYLFLNEDDNDFRYKNNLKNISLISDFSLNEEMLVHPFCDADFDDLIKINILDNLKEIICKFYIAPSFNEDGCYEEYLNLKNIIRNIKEKTQIQYDEIHSNFLFYRLMILEDNFDWVISEICDVLLNHKELLDMLDESNKILLKKLAEIKFEVTRKDGPNKIANYLDECCTYLDITVNPKTFDKSLIEKYYDPKFYSLEFFN